MNDRSSNIPALALILQDLRPARATYGRLVLSAPWGVDLPVEDGVRLHLVVEGRCVVEAPAGHATLGPGDVALLPQGGAHTIRNAQGSGTVPLATLPRKQIGDAIYRLRAGEAGEESLLVCCTVGFDAPAARRLLAAMPGLMVVRSSADFGPGLGGLVTLMADEARRERMGMATLLPRLADVVVTWVVRAWAEGEGADTAGWLGALADPRLGQALSAFHEDPGRVWNLAALARQAGLSRSAFAQSFRERLGVSPGRYMLDWRMALAAERLASPEARIGEVAADLGYGSEATFSRAFKRARGLAPGRVRREASRSA